MRFSPAFQKRLELLYEPLAIVLTVVIMSSLTFTMWNFAVEQVKAETRSRFDAQAGQIIAAIRESMLGYAQLLRGGAGLFAASTFVDRKKWQVYVQSLRIDDRHPSIQSVGYAPLVKIHEKKQHHTYADAQVSSYAIRSAGDRAEYVPVTYIEPANDINLRTVGFDMASEPVRRAALEQARDTADIAISGRVTLAQDIGRDAKAGVQMYFPIYAKDADLSRLDERRMGLAGYVYTEFRIHDQMRSVLGELRDLRVQLFDVTDTNDLIPLFDSHETSASGDTADFATSSSITLHGRTWILRMYSLPASAYAIDYSKPRIVLLSAVSIGLLVLAVIWSLSTLRTRAVALARRMTDALRRSEERLTLAMKGSNLAIFDWNVRTGEVTLSKEWTVILGGAPQATKTTIDDLLRLVHPDDIGHLRSQLQDTLAGKREFYEVEHRVKNAQGNWVWLLSRAKVVERDATGYAVRMTGTNANISERKQVEQMKDEFVSTVSHELRTPLTAIMGSLALLRESNIALSPDQSMMLDMACENCSRLQTVVNDTLNLEKITSGKMVFDQKPFMLEPFLRRSLILNRPYADRYKVRFELRELPPGTFLVADAERLMQVLTNLLSNAAKFSPEGEIVVVEATRVKGNYVRVTVTDRGPGVPLEFQNRIFHRFEQADGSNTRQRGGSGLGLSISKAVIEAMGGQIGFESSPGRGATFYFDLPGAVQA